MSKENTLPLRLVPVVVWLYLILTHATSAFSLPLTHQRSSSRLQHPGYSPSASAFSLPVITTIPDLTISEFNSWRTNLRKQYNFIRFKILERYIKLENRNYIID
jgi:hypothetical protein